MICAECLLSEATCTLYGLQKCANAAGKAMKWLDARTQNGLSDLWDADSHRMLYKFGVMTRQGVALIGIGSPQHCI